MRMPPSLGLVVSWSASHQASFKVNDVKRNEILSENGSRLRSATLSYDSNELNNHLPKPSKFRRATPSFSFYFSQLPKDRSWSSSSCLLDCPRVDLSLSLCKLSRSLSSFDFQVALFSLSCLPKFVFCLFRTADPTKLCTLPSCRSPYTVLKISVTFPQEAKTFTSKYLVFISKICNLSVTKFMNPYIKIKV